jgi:hypothetical protein
MSSHRATHLHELQQVLKRDRARLPAAQQRRQRGHGYDEPCVKTFDPLPSKLSSPTSAARRELGEHGCAPHRLWPSGSLWQQGGALGRHPLRPANASQAQRSRCAGTTHPPSTKEQLQHSKWERSTYSDCHALATAKDVVDISFDPPRVYTFPSNVKGVLRQVGSDVIPQQFSWSGSRRLC